MLISLCTHPNSALLLDGRTELTQNLCEDGASAGLAVSINKYPDPDSVKA